MKLINKFLKIMDKVIANPKAIFIQFLGLALMLFACTASAKLSDLGGNMANEGGLLAKYGLYFLSLGGLFIFIFGFLEYKKAKSQNGDKGMAVVMLLVGLGLGLGPLLYKNSAESVTDETYEVNTDYK